MERFVKRITNSVMMLSVIAIIIGLFMVIRPGTSLLTIGTIVGLYLLLHGMELLIVAISMRGYYVPYNAAIQGAVAMILGLVLISDPIRMLSLVSMILGLWIVISGVDVAKLALSLKKVEGTPWMIILILSVMDVIFGFYIIMIPEVASFSIIVCAGIVIIVHSVINIVDMVLLKKNAAEMEELIKEL